MDVASLDIGDVLDDFDFDVFLNGGDSYQCDQCSQRFDHDLDLKRHERIHLAIKPFPCTRCEKSFSRKDALARHLLVKECGTEAVSID